MYFIHIRLVLSARFIEGYEFHICRVELSYNVKNGTEHFVLL